MSKCNFLHFLSYSVKLGEIVVYVKSSKKVNVKFLPWGVAMASPPYMLSIIMVWCVPEVACPRLPQPAPGCWLWGLFPMFMASTAQTHPRCPWGMSHLVPGTLVLSKAIPVLFLFFNTYADDTDQTSCPQQFFTLLTDTDLLFPFAWLCVLRATDQLSLPLELFTETYFLTQPVPFTLTF